MDKLSIAREQELLRVKLYNGDEMSNEEIQKMFDYAVDEADIVSGREETRDGGIVFGSTIIQIRNDLWQIDWELDEYTGEKKFTRVFRVVKVIRYEAAKDKKYYIANPFLFSMKDWEEWQGQEDSK